MQSGEGRCVSRKCAGLQLATQARQVSTKWRWSTRPFPCPTIYCASEVTIPTAI